MVQTHLASVQRLVPHELTLMEDHLVVHQIGHIKVNQIEVGDHLADIHMLQVNAGHHQLLLGVLGQVVHELEVDLDNRLVEHVVHRIAHHCLEVQHDIGVHIHLVEVGVGEVHMGEHVPELVEHFVHAVDVALQHVSDELNGFGFAQINGVTIGSLVVAQVDNVVNALHEAGDLVEHLVVAVALHLVVVLAVAVANAVVVDHLRIVAHFDFLVP